MKRQHHIEHVRSARIMGLVLAGLWSAGCGTELEVDEANADTAAVLESHSTSCAPPGLNTCITAAVFTHVAGTGNIVGHYTVIDHPTTNGHQEALPIVTPNWTPVALPEAVNYRPIGVNYVAAIQRWAIYNEDGAAMPAGAAFNVRVGSAFAVYGPTPAISSYYFPFTDALPSSAKLFATASYNPRGSLGAANNWSPLAVWYTWPAWNLAHSDGLPFYDAGVGFHLADEPCAYAHETTPANVVDGRDTVITHPLADGNPKAVVLVTRVLGVNGLSSGTYPRQLAVHYRSDYGGGKWFIRGWDNDGDVMTPGATINVVVQAF